MSTCLYPKLSGVLAQLPLKLPLGYMIASHYSKWIYIRIHVMNSMAIYLFLVGKMNRAISTDNQ